tara:strand:+ start:324 stop:1076 length:753 start_codon:yes stop_codon:yes gene_type:complete
MYNLVSIDGNSTEVLSFPTDYFGLRAHDAVVSGWKFDGEKATTHVSVELSEGIGESTNLSGISLFPGMDRSLSPLAKVLSLRKFLAATSDLSNSNSSHMYYMSMGRDFLPSIAKSIAWNMKSVTDPTIGRYQLGYENATMSLPHYEDGRTTIDAVPFFRSIGLDSKVWSSVAMAKHLERKGKSFGGRPNYPDSWSDELKSSMLQNVGAFKAKSHARLNQLIVHEDAVLEMARMVADGLANKPFKDVKLLG